ncbi:hypothetical protein EOM81_13170 [bacterium]|nr:hypothetical protein [bacterium]
MMKLYCPNCGYNVNTIRCMTVPATRNIPVEYEECCPDCGLTEDNMWEPESWEGEYDEVDNSR